MKSLKIRGLAAAALTSLCAHQIANAADEPADKPATSLGKITVSETEVVPYTVEETRSATKLDLSLRDTPQSVTVFTRDRLDDQNLQSLRDVLDFTPGV